MENTKEFNLIDGVFTPSDANSLLCNLIDEKIKFHKLDDFSNYIRHDRDSQHSIGRIAALVESKAELREWIDLAKQQTPSLIIKSIVTITFDESFQES